MRRAYMLLLAVDTSVVGTRSSEKSENHSASFTTSTPWASQ